MELGRLAAGPLHLDDRGGLGHPSRDRDDRQGAGRGAGAGRATRTGDDPAARTGDAASPAPPPPPIIANLAAEPQVISPDGDGIADALTISYALAGRAAVTATVTDVNGATVATLFTGQKQGNPAAVVPVCGGRPRRRRLHAR